MIKDDVLRESSWVLMGRSQSTHGLTGGFVVDLINAESQVWAKGKSIQLRSPNQPTPIESIIIETKGKVGQKIILKVDKIDHIDELSKILPLEIWIKRDDFVPLASDEIYLQDMLGFVVQDEAGKIFGAVKGFLETHTSTMLILNDPQETLIPFIKAWVKLVDEDLKLITIFPITEY